MHPYQLTIPLYPFLQHLTKNRARMVNYWPSEVASSADKKLSAMLAWCTCLAARDALTRA